MFRTRATGSRGDANAPRSRLDVGELRRLFALTLPYRSLLVPGMVAVAISGLLALALPLVARDLFNRAFAATGSPMSEARLDSVILLLLAIFLVQALFNFARVYLLGLVGEGVVADLRKRLFRHLLTLPVAFYDERRSGEITSRLTADVATVQQAVSQGAAQLLNQSITLLGATIVLFVLNARLTLVMLAVVPTVIIAGAIFGRRLRRISAGFQDRVADANAAAEEAITGIRVVKAFNAEGLEEGNYRRSIDASWQLGRARVLARALFVPAIILAMFSGVALVLWNGGRQIVAGALAPGDLVAFLLLMLFVAGSVSSFTGLYAQLQEAVGASQRIFELLAQPSEPGLAGKEAMTGSQRRGTVVFEAVTFRYRPDSPPILDRIDLDVPAGTVVALVGPSGAGKSTLVSLLPRFYDPEHGRVTIDGVDIRDMPVRELRGLLAVVPQETLLFSGPLAENVRLGRPEASDDEVRQALAAANALDFALALPEGVATNVGDRGLKLSGGQRQRIAIARALLKDPRILILDEATSSLDSESEAQVQEAMQRLMRGRTTFVIAHRLATIQGADRIVVLADGRIVEEGTHGQLLERGGLYSDLYRRQFEGRAPSRQPA